MSTRHLAVTVFLEDPLLILRAFWCEQGSFNLWTSFRSPSCYLLPRRPKHFDSFATPRLKRVVTRVLGSSRTGDLTFNPPDSPPSDSPSNGRRSTSLDVEPERRTQRSTAAGLSFHASPSVLSLRNLETKISSRANAH
jgi:hypothetical protein